MQNICNFVSSTFTRHLILIWFTQLSQRDTTVVTTQYAYHVYLSICIGIGAHVKTYICFSFDMKKIIFP